MKLASKFHDSRYCVPCFFYDLKSARCLGGWDWHACTPTGETKGQWEPALSHRELGPVPCADLEGWGRGDGGGSFRERGHIYSYS